MRPALLALVTGVLIALGTTTALAEPPEICGRAQPTNLPSVRGFAWTGTVTRLRSQGSIIFNVDHVYAYDPTAGAPPAGPLRAGEPLRLGNTSCNPITGLVVNRRYLVSTRSIDRDGPQTIQTVIWELDGDRASFLHMYAHEFHLPIQLVAADTLAAAIALVAPGAALPPTDSSPEAAAGYAGTPLALPVVFAFGFVMAMLRLFRRRSSKQ
jgi:hypothetical protein